MAHILTEDIRSIETHTKLKMIRRILADTNACDGFDGDSLASLLHDVDNYCQRIRRTAGID